MMCYLLAAVVIAISFVGANGGQYLNCNEASDKNLVYVVQDAVYVCEKGEEKLEYCIINDAARTSLDVSYIRVSQSGETEYTYCNGKSGLLCTLTKRGGKVTRYSSIDAAEAIEQNC